MDKNDEELNAGDIVLIDKRYRFDGETFAYGIIRKQLGTDIFALSAYSFDGKIVLAINNIPQVWDINKKFLKLYHRGGDSYSNIHQKV